MRLGVLSDTHDHLPMIEKAVDLFLEQRVEAVLHAGDIVSPFAAKALARFQGPLYAVYGNNDGEREGLQKLLPGIAAGPRMVEVGGRRILLHHDLGGCREAVIARAELVVTGHTHVPVVRREGGRLFVNPGECCGWLYHQPTVAILETEGPEAEIVGLE